MGNDLKVSAAYDKNFKPPEIKAESEHDDYNSDIGEPDPEG